MRTLSSAVNGDGRFVAFAARPDLIAFQSLAGDLLCKEKCGAAERDINLVSDVFVHDRSSRLTTRVSSDDGVEWMAESRAPSMDGSGRIVIFSSRHPVGPRDWNHDEDLLIDRR